MRIKHGLQLIALMLCHVTRGDEPSVTSTKPASPSFPQRLDVRHLPNAIRVHDQLISGGLPEGAAAFQSLKDLGVKTIISVDGAQPDVKLANKFGLRYVHLPHGYDGISTQRGHELAKAVRDLPGPVYVHCHHGKHRSPVAAAIVAVELGMVPPESALNILKTAGTSEQYRGLYACARQARPLAKEVLDQLKVEFQEAVPVPPLAKAMVDIEQHHDHLKQFETQSWKKLSEHPALTPSHEALLLREAYTELLRTEEIQHKPLRFRELLQNSLNDAQQLEDLLGELPKEGPRDSASRMKLKTSLMRNSQNCQQCHREFRDVPLSEKTASQ